MIEDRAFPHLTESGQVHMVSIGQKEDTERIARAQGRLETRGEIIASVRAGGTPKGDVLAVARIAAILGIKHTSDWIPLAHPISVTGITVDITMETAAFLVSVEVKTVGKTGVEMEALTGVTAALLTLYDMLKAQDRAMTMQGIQLMEKSGGRSGLFRREDQVNG